jgi:hypothetical protein
MGSPPNVSSCRFQHYMKGIGLFQFKGIGEKKIRFQTNLYLRQKYDISGFIILTVTIIDLS